MSAVLLSGFLGLSVGGCPACTQIKENRTACRPLRLNQTELNCSRPLTKLN
jgi:hypothetical protein